MIHVLRTDSNHPDFVALVAQLDAYLAKTDGEEHAFYHQFNKIDQLKQVVLVYENDQAIACGAIKEFDNDAMEVKRMYTVPNGRGKGAATQVLAELESWASELGYSKCVLETGKRQAEAIGLYKKNNYIPIPNYGQYEGMDNSVCFEKAMKAS